MYDLTVKPKVHLFVCVNERDSGVCCAPTITVAMVKEVKKWLVAQGLAGSVYCTKTGCLGFCNEQGGVACVYPQGKYVQGLQSVDDLKNLILAAL